VAFVLWTASIAIWHLPFAYEAALGNGTLHVLEHLSFMVTGFLVWTHLLDPARRRELRVPTGRVLYALGLFGIGHAVVHPLLFGGGILYDAYEAQDERLFGLSASADQSWAGAVMTVEQVLTLGTLVVVTLWPHVRRRSPTEAPQSL
jgi:cytochrome c oxidase assembly factor CtaG